jgi:hypothetical protein
VTVTEAPPVAARTIFELFAEAKRMVGPVGKDSTNTQQHFNYRGIDAVVNAIAKAFDELGIIPVPMLERYEYKEGVEIGQKRSLMGHVQVEVSYRFYGPLGDYFDAKVPGEAMDSGDKATPKAMSVAYRICLLQTLNLPTSDPDPDSQSYERPTAGRRSGDDFDNAAPAAPRNGRQDQDRPEQSQRREIPPQEPLDDDDTWAQLIADIKTLADCEHAVVTLKDDYNRGEITAQRTTQVLYWIRQKETRVRAEAGSEAAAPADDDPAQAWIAAFRAELAKAADEQLPPMRGRIGRAVADRAITPEQGSQLNQEIVERRRALSQDQAAKATAA